MRIDLRVLGFVAGISLITALVFSFVPALRSTRWSRAKAVVHGSDRSPVARSRLGRFLIVAQGAMSVVLLVGAGLFVRSAWNMHDVDVGFDAENLVLFDVPAETLQYDDARVAMLYDDMRREIERVPGVLGVTTSMFPLVNRGGFTNRANVGACATVSEGGIVCRLHVHPGFLETMGIPITLGRDLTGADDANAPPVALVSETFVRQHLGDSSPIGCTRGFGAPANRDEFEIVGLVPDVSIDAVQREMPPVVYLSELQQPPANTTFAVRKSTDPVALVPSIREVVRQIDPNVPLVDVRTQVEHIERGLALELLLARATAAFGIVALLLASIGLYGLMSHSVTSRVPEIGVRMALGARREQVLRMIMLESSRLVLAGIVLGLGGAWAATRLIAFLLYGVEPDDPATLEAVVILLVTTAACAAFVPARRASRVDPMVALRHE